MLDEMSKAIKVVISRFCKLAIAKIPLDSYDSTDEQPRFRFHFRQLEDSQPAPQRAAVRQQRVGRNPRDDAAALRHEVRPVDDLLGESQQRKARSANDRCLEKWCR